jgi:hypothetical protein
MKTPFALMALAAVAPFSNGRAADNLIDFPGPGYREQLERVSSARVHAQPSLDFVVTGKVDPGTLSSDRLNELRAQIEEAIRARYRPAAPAPEAATKR